MTTTRSEKLVTAVLMLIAIGLVATVSGQLSPSYLQFSDQAPTFWFKK
ncbi:hypothetical protein ACQ4M4_23690 [Leptolyngbya sp. AN02str]